MAADCLSKLSCFIYKKVLISLEQPWLTKFLLLEAVIGEFFFLLLNSNFLMYMIYHVLYLKGHNNCKNGGNKLCREESFVREES